MKNRFVKLTGMAMVALVAISFSAKDIAKKDVKVKTSKIVWQGYQFTGSQEGTIALSSGYLTFDEDKLIGGEFIIDMTTIVSTDLEGEYKGKLEAHLKSQDFFDVENYPKARLVFKEVKMVSKNSSKILGYLTIKGKTEPIKFEVSVYGNRATASLKIDRAKFNIRFASESFFDNLKEKIIYDDFDLQVDLEF